MLMAMASCPCLHCSSHVPAQAVFPYHFLFYTQTSFAPALHFLTWPLGSTFSPWGFPLPRVPCSLCCIFP